ncbi:hypothetical protein [Trueperella sp. LYQ143]|uniref:hypothetical protein n=1 Tax=Trueperella sp. LYQ143 TaxID=3391059 RepID=UPI0039832951
MRNKIDTFADVSLAHSHEILRAFVPLRKLGMDYEWASWEQVIGDSINLYADSDLYEVLEDNRITEWTLAEGVAPESFICKIHQLSLMYGSGPWKVIPYEGITRTRWDRVEQNDLLSCFFEEWERDNFPGVLTSASFHVWSNRYGNSVVLSGSKGLFRAAQRMGLECRAALASMVLPFDLQEHYRAENRLDNADCAFAPLSTRSP